jgi:hypothetical protein
MPWSESLDWCAPGLLDSGRDGRSHERRCEELESARRTGTRETKPSPMIMEFREGGRENRKEDSDLLSSLSTCKEWVERE